MRSIARGIGCVRGPTRSPGNAESKAGSPVDLTATLVFEGLLLHCIRRPGKANKKEQDRQQQHDIAPGRPAVIVAAIMAVLMFVVTIVIVFSRVGVHVLLGDDVLGMFMLVSVAMIGGMTMDVFRSLMLVLMTTVMVVIGIAGLAHGDPERNAANNRE